MATQMRPPPPPGGDESMGPALLGVIWAQVALDIVVVALRFFVRHKKRSLGADDWLMLIAMFLFIATVAVETVIVSYGLGRHMYYIPPQNGIPFLKWIFILQSFTFFTLAFAKTSIALFIMRLMGPDRYWRKRFLLLNIAIFFIFTILTTIFDLVACRPLKANWDHTTPNAKCWPLKVNANWAIFISSYSAFLDVLLALLPISMMWNLKLDVKKKVAICILLGLGILSGIAAAVKTSMSNRLGSRADFTWEAWGLYAWSTTEYFLNIFCGSVPVLKPIYDYFVKGKPIKESPTTGGMLPWSGISWSDRMRRSGVSRLFSTQRSSRSGSKVSGNESQSQTSLRRTTSDDHRFGHIQEYKLSNV
ncbi:hypothetical protein GQ43DRAFT_440644 [Delitschia confertaspora ATCC 74209]|uniref:Rhodopsin domain-containing protein n=1 Tax=Delitschia confertaspora ATCC 74209 TaxID=1513339 RepID=A0A9P4JNA8_9PLEO|nr:hypothetical protein GQ43DRAFT_440644 [Delitschia confertaspora ATCC 74209]